MGLVFLPKMSKLSWLILWDLLSRGYKSLFEGIIAVLLYIGKFESTYLINLFWKSIRLDTRSSFLFALLNTKSLVKMGLL